LRPSSRQRVVDRWGGDERVLSLGFIPVPRLFLLWGASLKPKSLTPSEMLFVITLIGVKWSARHPRLSYDAIAARTGLSAEYCRKIAKALDRRGLVKRSRRQGDANHFDLTEVFRQLSDFDVRSMDGRRAE
jgi:DNA-binding MarR family transcriptional regulator